MLRKKVLTILLGSIVVFIALGVYLKTLAPTITAGDSSEMITAAAVLGIPHQSSYPLNTILGHLFTKLPWGNLPWRVNLMSAVLHSLTVGAIYLAILEIFSLFSRPYTLDPSGYFIALGASLFLAFSRNFWINSLKAEVFPLNSFLASLMLLLILKWRNAAKSTSQESWLSLRSSLPPSEVKRSNQPLRLVSIDTLGKRLMLYLFAFIFGLGMAHHQTIVLLIPACLYLVWKNQPELVKTFIIRVAKMVLPDKYVREGKEGGEGKESKEGKRGEVMIVKMILLFLLGLSIYLSIIFLAQRNPALNWSNPDNLMRALRSFLRADVGGFRAPAVTDVPSQEAPIDQLDFYFRSLVNDFTLWGMISIVLGVWFLWQKKKELFNFVILGILFSGPFFLVYANFPLNGDFAQATILRFNLLSEMFWTICLAAGLFFIWEKIKAYTADKKDKTDLFARILVSVGLGLIFLWPLVSHFKSVDQSQNTFAYDFAKKVLTGTEDNAMILLSGDIPNFSVDYLRFVEGMEGNRIIFSPGQFHMSWFVKQLAERYPELKIPPALPGYRFTVTHQLIEANWESGRPVYVMPELSQLDPVVGQTYKVWPKNFLFRLAKKDEEFKTEEFKLASDNLWQSISPKKLSWLTRFPPSLDSPLFFYYSRHFYNLGSVFEEQELYEDAIKEYERTLEIDPGFSLAYKALGTIYGYKMEKKDRIKAIDNFSQYLPFASSDQDWEVVRQAIWELDQQEATLSGQVREATGSAEIEEEVATEDEGLK